MTLASGGSPMFPLVVHQPASPSIWLTVQSLRRGLSTNPVSVCFVCCVLDSVCELFGETICNVCGCSCYFVVECYGCVLCVWWCSVG